MSQAVVERVETRVARPLAALVRLIKDDIKNGDDAAERAGAPFYRAAGEKLLEAKGQFDTAAGFYDWAKRHFGRAESAVKNYISFAKISSVTIGNAMPKTMNDHLRSMKRDIPTSGAVRREYTAPIDATLDRVNVDLLNRHREDMKRADEREAERKLALQLIDIGYKALATKLRISFATAASEGRTSQGKAQSFRFGPKSSSKHGGKI